MFTYCQAVRTKTDTMTSRRGVQTVTAPTKPLQRNNTNYEKGLKKKKDRNGKPAVLGETNELAKHDLNSQSFFSSFFSPNVDNYYWPSPSLGLTEAELPTTL